jgi:hypothetical protein
MKSRVRTSLRKAPDLFRIIGNTIISHETVRRLVPHQGRSMMESSGYFAYDEQYTYIDGKEKYFAMLKDARARDFVE